MPCLLSGVLADVRVKSSDFVPHIKAVSLDIETTMDGKTIHSIAVYGMESETPVELVWLHWPTNMPIEPLEIFAGIHAHL